MIKGLKKIELLEAIILKKKKKLRQILHQILLKPQYKCAEVPQYIEKFSLVLIIYKRSFNLPFQSIIYHLILSNNSNNFFRPV